MKLGPQALHLFVDRGLILQEVIYERSLRIRRATPRCFRKDGSAPQGVPTRRLLQLAVDELIRQMEDDELLEESARVAQRSGLREKDAVRIVKDWRSNPKRRSAS